MRKRDKLYTVNKWNKNLFVTGGGVENIADNYTWTPDGVASNYYPGPNALNNSVHSFVDLNGVLNSIRTATLPIETIQNFKSQYFPSNENSPQNKDYTPSTNYDNYDWSYTNLPKTPEWQPVQFPEEPPAGIPYREDYTPPSDSQESNPNFFEKNAGYGKAAGIAGTLAGEAAHHVISDGLKSKAGTVMKGVGNAVGEVVGAVPIVGGFGKGLVNLATGIQSGLVNAAFGTATDEKKKARNEAGIATYKNYTNAAGFNDLRDVDTVRKWTAAHDSGFLNKGWANKRNKDDLNRWVGARNFALSSIENNAENLAREQTDWALANYAAYGGELNTENMDNNYMDNMLSAGGSIHIKHPGRLTALKERTGKTEAELWAEGNPDVRKMITFARNARKWEHAYGGPLFAFGGDVQTNSSDFSTGLTHINAGGTHEENPNDGVQVGVDQEGTPNLVEEGEVIYNDYVYSDRIMCDPITLNRFKQSKKKEITYADLAKKLEKEISERPNDPISKAAFASQMNVLAEQQERQKQEMEAEKAKEVFNSLSPEDQVGIMQYAQEMDNQEQQQGLEAMAMQEMQQNPEMMQQAMMQEQMPMEEGMPQEGYAMGGHLFADGGPTQAEISAFRRAHPEYFNRGGGFTPEFLAIWKRAAGNGKARLERAHQLIQRRRATNNRSNSGTHNNSANKRTTNTRGAYTNGGSGGRFNNGTSASTTIVPRSSNNTRKNGPKRKVALEYHPENWSKLERFMRGMAESPYTIYNTAQRAKTMLDVANAMGRGVNSAAASPRGSVAPASQNYTPNSETLMEDYPDTTTYSNNGSTNANTGYTPSGYRENKVTSDDVATDTGNTSYSNFGYGDNTEANSTESPVTNAPVRASTTPQQAAVATSGPNSNVAAVTGVNAPSNTITDTNNTSTTNSSVAATPLSLRDELLNIVKGNNTHVTTDDVAKWLKDNGVGLKNTNAEDIALDSLNGELLDTVDWNRLLQDKAFRDALAKNNSALGHAVSRGYDFGSAKPVLGNEYDWNPFIDSQVKTYNKSKTPGNQAGTYVIDNAFPLGDFKTIEELENSDDYKAFTDKVVKFMEEHPDIKLNDSTTDDFIKSVGPEGAAIMSYLDEVGAQTPSDSRAQFFTLDEDGNTIWAPDAIANYKLLRNDHKGGVMHLTPSRKHGKVKEINFIQGEDGSWKEVLGSAPEDLGDPVNYEWNDTKTGTHFVHHYFKNPNNPAAVTGKDGKKKRRIAVNYQDDLLGLADLGPLISMGMMASGVGKPNYSGLDKALAIAENPVETVRPSHIGGYYAYNPLDPYFEEIQADAANQAAQRAVANSSLPTANKQAATIALDYNYQNGVGERHRKAQAYNNAEHLMALQQQKDTDKWNAAVNNEMAMKNAAMRNEANHQLAALTANVGAQKLAGDAAWNKNWYGNIQALANSIGAREKENRTMNMIADLAVNNVFGNFNPNNFNPGRMFRWEEVPEDENVGAKGGKLKRKKKRGLTC